MCLPNPKVARASQSVFKRHPFPLVTAYAGPSQGPSTSCITYQLRYPGQVPWL